MISPLRASSLLFIVGAAVAIFYSAVKMWGASPGMKLMSLFMLPFYFFGAALCAFALWLVLSAVSRFQKH